MFRCNIRSTQKILERLDASINGCKVIKNFSSFQFIKNQTNRRHACFQNLRLNTKFLSSSSIVDGLSLLESTTAKLNKSIDSVDAYLAGLMEEKERLNTMIINSDVHDKNMDVQQASMRVYYLTEIETLMSRLRKMQEDMHDLTKMLEVDLQEETSENNEMRQAVEHDLQQLKDDLFQTKLSLLDKLVPDDLEDKENVVLELSAGVGGNESRIFCAELYEMYRAFSNFMGWSFDSLEIDKDTNEVGSFMRKALIEVSGNYVYRMLKFESGVHRVQRVPKTESKGRIHTSTVGIVVTPKPAEIKIELVPKDLKIETKTSSGPGGQHVNKTESAVRIFHLPTGLMVYCEDERMQAQNRARAMAQLKQKLYQREYEEQLNRRQMNRRLQIGSSGRSERIRTYNFIQDRISDHRLDENFKNISSFMTNGHDLANMINSLRYEQRIEILNELVENFDSKKQK